MLAKMTMPPSRRVLACLSAPNAYREAGQLLNLEMGVAQRWATS